MNIVGKHPAYTVLEEEPLNGGPPPALLGQSVLTPNELFFVRNHGSLPEVDAGSFRLSVGGQVKRPLSLSLREMQMTFPTVTLTAVLQCAGNRRKDLIALRPIPGELPWGIEAIGTAVWGGVALRDLLLAAGVESKAQHVAFVGLDRVMKGGQTFGFGGSIPLPKAMSPEVILAYEMNGQPLPPLHGYPLRAIVPGYIGARSVKWLSDIIVQSQPSMNYFQTHAYKVFPPHVRAEDADWQTGLTLGEFPVSAAILQPGDGAVLRAGLTTVRGYAVASGGRSVQSVEVSQDGGKTWIAANLLEEVSPWAWRLWEAALTLGPGTRRLVVRAWDSAAQTQPEDAATIWNFKGYVNNAWHRVSVNVVP